MTNVVTEHITKTPGVCGGKACTLSDVHAALAYYFDNREEIEEDIQRNNGDCQSDRGAERRH